MDFPVPAADVDRLMSELTALFESHPSPDDLKVHAHIRLSAFIGRIVLRDDGFAPPDEIAPLLQAARSAIQRMAVPGRGSIVRMELLAELDKAIAAMRTGPA